MTRFFLIVILFGAGASAGCNKQESNSMTKPTKPSTQESESKKNLVAISDQGNSYSDQNVDFLFDCGTHRGKLDIPAKDILALTPGKGENLPVSALQAINLATSRLVECQFGTGQINWKLDSIALFPVDGRDNAWYWVADFSDEQNSSFIKTVMKIGVLMNGNSVIPTFEKKTDADKEKGIHFSE